ncbi:protein translocase subunit SecD [Sporosalibacterium faouarense]|uniref:protein translocase subunit SecD n=1 Tax=Sporosalibacterium faouarense TaxID=516123 RepID=UPI001FAFBBFE|nr:protein translocase subunit SecD [Sporosalibacterium faouarense]
MRLRSTIIFLLVVVIVAAIALTGIYGIDLGKYEITSIKDEMDLGLDLAGGVFVVLEAQTDAKGDELQKLMEQSKAIITERVDGLGVAEPNIVIEGDNRIRVELAGLQEPQKAIEMIGKTAQLQFIDPEGDIVITGEHIKESTVKYYQTSRGYQQPVVSLEMNGEGAERFGEVTTKLAVKTNVEDKIIYIVLDGEVISSPKVNSAITDGQAIIEGMGSMQEASRLATLIRAGALPVEMKEIQSSVIGASLGLEALDKSVFAAGIGLLLIFLFMLIYYKIPGVVANIALSAYILIVLGIMISLDVKLTLPGIAGLILSIGMAVDANVVIFERIKEEIRNGKTLRASVDSGFKKALSTVLDANVTTLIASGVLYYFGTGPIKGFGVTLFYGIIASMITAIFITRFLLKLTINMKLTKNTKLYGA